MTRGEKNKARHKEQVRRKPKTGQCPMCGGLMTWCEGCRMFSSYCCDQYGTCMCS